MGVQHRRSHRQARLESITRTPESHFLYILMTTPTEKNKLLINKLFRQQVFFPPPSLGTL